MQHHAGNQLNGVSFSEWIPLLIIVAAALLYLYAVISIRAKESSWNNSRTLSFTIGITLLVIAMLPSLMQWAHQDLRGHMVQHLLVGMYAPLFLVLGAPVTLALKFLPVKRARGITAILKSSVFYFLSHPVTAFMLNIGGMYVLYLTPLYSESLTKPYLHYLTHIHFLAAGYLFTWSMIGPDPAPKRPGHVVRVSVLFVSIAAHAFLSKYMYAHLYPLLSPPNEEQIREAAKLMYYWGDLAELLLTITLFMVWYRKRGTTRFQPAPVT